MREQLDASVTKPLSVTHVQEFWNLRPTHRFRPPELVDEVDEGVILKESQSRDRSFRRVLRPGLYLIRFRWSCGHRQAFIHVLFFRRLVVHRFSVELPEVGEPWSKDDPATSSHRQAMTRIAFLITRRPFPCQVSRKFSTFVPKSRTRFRSSVVR